MALTSSDKPLLELFIKASPSEKGERGPCPISQKWFMVYYLLTERGCIDLRVTPVNMERPPVEYEALQVSRKLPVVHVTKGNHPQTGADIGGTVADMDDAIEHLMEIWTPQSGLTHTSASYKATENLYRNINAFLHLNNVNPMLNDLKALEEYLGRRGTRYLDGDEIGYADCVLMPKLQHLRVACKAYKNFDIPYNLTHIWRYMNEMYSTEAFKVSCPADRDILIQYFDKVRPMVKDLDPPSLQAGVKTSCIPPDVDIFNVRESLQGNASGNEASSPNSTNSRDTRFPEMQSYLFKGPEAHQDS